MGLFATSIANMTRTYATSHTSPNTLSFLLHHFSTSAYTTLSSKTGQMIIKQQIPGLVMQFPFLLEAVIAFSASHMSYLKQAQTSAPQSNMSFVASWHIVRALRGYGQKISEFQIRGTIKSSKAGQDSIYDKNEFGERKVMDALVAACLILTSMFYHVSWSNDQPRIWSSMCLSTDKPTKSGGCSFESPSSEISGFVGSVTVPIPRGVPSPLSNDHAERNSLDSARSPPAQVVKPQCDWLSNVTGMSVILALAQFREHLPHSIWYPFLAEADDAGRETDPWTEPATSHTLGEHQSASRSTAQHSIFDNKGNDCTSIHPPLPLPSCPSSQLPHLSRLLHLSTHIHRPGLRGLLMHLITLLPLDTTDLSTFSRIISFPSYFPSPTFPKLVAAREPVVLLMLGYWFGMLEGVPHWWCNERGRREGRVVERWLTSLVQQWDHDTATQTDGHEHRVNGDGLDLWGLQKRGEAEIKGWGYRRWGLDEGYWEETRTGDWRTGVKMAAQEFVAWREGRGLRS